MTIEENKALVLRFNDEVFTKGNLEAVDELLSEDFVDITAPPGTPTGREGVKAAAQMFRSAFTDWGADIEGLIAEGDIVVFWGTGHGIHAGEFMGVPGNGKEIRMPGAHIVRVHERSSSTAATETTSGLCVSSS